MYERLKATFTKLNIDFEIIFVNDCSPDDSEEVIRSFRPDWARVTGNQLSLAFKCGSPEEVDELYARVVGAGFDGEKEPWDAFWGQRYAQLADPDGVPVDLYAQL